MPNLAELSVVTSGIVGVVGVLVPAFNRLVDRRHERAMKKRDQDYLRRERYWELRETLYLDMLRSDVSMVNYIRHVEENIEGEPSDPEAFETGARVIVYASDAVRELQDSFHIGVQNWAAVSAGDSISDSDIDDWASFTYFCHDMLSKQIRAELSAGMVSMQTLDGLNSIDVIRDSPANRSPKQRKNFLVARFGVNIQRKV